MIRNLVEDVTFERVKYGDFQTPLELATQICKKLCQLGIEPQIVIEPTCGIGAFVHASFQVFNTIKKVIALEINPFYLSHLHNCTLGLQNHQTLDLLQADFFQYNWQELFTQFEKHDSLLVVGNFPWVTNSQQGSIAGNNLPEKQNHRHLAGMDAITGKSNFDISEWMLIHMAKHLQHRKHSHLAMLCKTAVARKFLQYLQENKIGVASASIFTINAKKYFDVTVEACLLVCAFDTTEYNYDYRIYPTLESECYTIVGYRYNRVVRDLAMFDKHTALFGTSEIKWRSGIKHDCATVMELVGNQDVFYNSKGDRVELEADYIYPLLKGSDVANNRVTSTNRYLIVPQKAVGEATHPLHYQAPKLWSYLESHAALLDVRKSRIYKNNPRFSIFGVGSYTFAAWKIAICSLYKKLDFCLVGMIDQKPVVFDDTVYLISFDNYEEACQVLEFLKSKPVQEFLTSLIFWDEKRPIKTSILQCLRLQMASSPRNLSLFGTEEVCSSS